MNRSRQTPTWPFLSLLVCLFALSVVSPRSWERIAREKPLGQLVSHSRPADRNYGNPTLAVRPELPPAPVASQSDDALAELARGCLADCLEPTQAELAAIEAASHGATWSTASECGPVLPQLEAPRGRFTGLKLPSSVADLAHRPQRIDLNGPSNFSTVEMRDAISAAELAARESIDRELAAVNAAEAAGTASPWSEPAALLAWLEALTYECECSSWAQRVAQQVRQLARSETAQTPEIETALEALQAEVAVGRDLADSLARQELAVELRRVAHALERRLIVWRHVPTLERIALEQHYRVDPQRLAQQLAMVNEAMGDTPTGMAWQDYLLMDALQVVAAGSSRENIDISREIASQVLRRLDSPNLSAAQRQFLLDSRLAALETELRGWAAEPVSSSQLLAAIETYEHTGLPSDARRVMEYNRRLNWSALTAERELAEQMECYYRNANVRVAISGSLLERLMPGEPDSVEALNDTVVGIPVSGHKYVNTRVGLRLEPDPYRLRLILDVTGTITADTRAEVSLATLYNRTSSSYRVQRPITVGLDGMRLGQPQASAKSNMQLRNVETTLDSIPLLGSLTQDIVRQRQADQAAQARSEIQKKVADQAAERVESQSAERLREAEQRLRKQLIEPLNRLGLEPTAFQMETTTERLIVRARLAGSQQLGSHTPRPRAPSDSLISLQFHQSALNNALEGLELEGRMFRLLDLHAHVIEKVGLDPRPAPEAMHENIAMCFAAKDAARVHLANDRVQLTLTLDDLIRDNQRSGPFQVHVFYRPGSGTDSGELVREGTVQLVTEGLSMKNQIALRGIFSKIFARDSSLPLLPKQLAENPGLAELRVTQLLVDDGWLGMAIGPQRPAATPSTERQIIARR